MDRAGLDGTAFGDSAVAAKEAGLRYVSDADVEGIRRLKHGDGFCYRNPHGALLKDKAAVERIKALAIPPAWTDVWISPYPNSHLAATGRDAKGRKQYRYNPEFSSVRGAAKYEHILAFAKVLPKLRQKVAEHLALRGMPREKVLASIVSLLESTLIRVGNEDYARQNGSFGLTTLRNRHVQVHGSELRFLFLGKSGKTWRLKIHDRRVAKIIRACQDLPGQHLFQYRDDAGAVQKISSGDINAYLRELTGRDITAKDFRTWAGTVMAATILDGQSAASESAAKKTIRAALEQVAARLGNTVAVCRKCYVHPEVLIAFAAGESGLPKTRSKSGEGALSAEERAVLSFLSRRLDASPRNAA